VEHLIEKRARRGGWNNGDKVIPKKFGAKFDAPGYWLLMKTVDVLWYAINTLITEMTINR
jgi:hypothetical protein